MSSELDIEVIEEKHVSNPVAKKLLEKIIKRIEEKEGTIPLLLHKTMEYLRQYSKMDADKAEALERELSAFELKPETIVMFVNICPETLDEARTLLVLEERTIDTEELNKILEVVKKYCS
ncbi:DNA-directed RNA polymerase subunit F [Desulfurococcaceae archaeon MEX13E-LK6-19]|nr:DNA-directed RNA polymerase subunit F [Desulfurococcaceae archaeon MEX13E-LK6-19]